MLSCAMILENITMPAFTEGLERTRSVIIPFGSVEEHGQHLPLGTDTIHVYELAKEVADICPVFVAPPVWYGLCRSTSQHPGTITVSARTVETLGVEIATSLYSHGLRNFVMISGHAGGTHMASIINAGEKILETLPEAKVAVLSVLDLSAELAAEIIETPGDSHAGEVETSLMQYLRPDDVKGTSPEEYPAFPGKILARDKIRAWPGGVWGNPAKASRDKGKTILSREAMLLCGLIKDLETFDG